jgi:hypothetical protein
VVGDYSNYPPETWIMSEYRHIQEFLATKDHPGIEKIRENITKARNDLGLELNLLEKKENKIFLIGDTVEQKKIKAEASLARGLYAEAKDIKIGDTPSLEYFMPPSSAAKELNFRYGLRESPKFEASVKKFYYEMASHRPHTTASSYQVAVPYLYGKQVTQLEQLVYKRMAGMNILTEAVPQDWQVMTESLPPKDTKWVFKGELDKLLKELEDFSIVLKDYNKADSALKGAKNKSKADKAPLEEDKKAKGDILKSHKERVKAAECAFPPSAYVENKLDLVTRKMMVAYSTKLAEQKAASTKKKESAS